MAAANEPLTLVHEDEHLLAFDKPAGLLCVPGRGPDKADCLSARAQARWPEALVVHRLDMATSGLVLMARSLPVQRALGDAFASRRMHKRYEAIVEGIPQPAPSPDGWQLIDAPLMVDWPNRPKQKIDPAGKPSQTRWRVLRTLPGASHLLLEPLTGRSHQLRLHLASIGHPILGDFFYGDMRRSPRLLLHASELAFEHPVTGAAVMLRSASGFGEIGLPDAVGAPALSPP